jgi:ligand-binding sensor domain-containing protein/serine phosphatase RsbU (regulator of sigma subunit)
MQCFNSRIALNLLITCLLLLGSPYGYAQKWDEQFIPSAIEEGMTDLTITSILQDKYGYMWFGTKNGLHQFDGYSFNIYNSDPSDPTTLSDNTILCLAETKDGLIWVGTESHGLNLLDPLTGTVTRFEANPESPDALSSDQIYALMVDGQDRLWIGTYDSGFCVYSNGKFEQFKPDTSDPSKIGEGTIWSFLEDDQGYIWISTWGSGLSRFDYATKTFKHFRNDPNDSTSLSDNLAGPAMQDKNGNLWITTWKNGLEHFDYETELFTHYTKDGPKGQRVSFNVLWPVIQDKEGNIWVGTYEAGLDKLNVETGELKNYQYDPAFPRKFLHNNIWSLYIDRNDILWIGTEGGGVMRYGGIKKQFTTIRPIIDEKTPATNELVKSIEATDQHVWIGTWYHGLLRYDLSKDTIESFYRQDRAELGETGANQIRSLYIAQNGHIWVGSNRQGAYILDPNTNTMVDFKHDQDNKFTLSYNNVRAITQDIYGNIWIGTTHGLNEFNKEDSTFTRYLEINSGLTNEQVNALAHSQEKLIWIGTNNGLQLYDLDAKEFHQLSQDGDLSSNAVNDLLESFDGTLWIGTKSGLNKYDPTTKEFTSYSIKNQKALNSINSIEEGPDRNLWLSSDYGLLKFNPKEESFSFFDKNEGVEILNYAPGASSMTSSGIMFFGGIGGVTGLNPNNIEVNHNPPEMLITGIIINGVELTEEQHPSEIQELVVPYSNNSIRISFTGFSYVDPSKTRYAYILEGFDHDWNYVGSNRTAFYANLAAGDYTFKVKAVNEDGIWSEEIVLQVHIPTPYWQKWWFYLICLILFGSIIWVILKWRLRKLEKEKERLETIVEERTKEVVEQKEIILEKNKELMDSINYAKGIQDSILPTTSFIEENAPNSFVLFKPKDIVSGDFYWMERYDDTIYCAVVDCTGHGVPGAFVSMVGANGLHRTVNEYGLRMPNEMLDKLAILVERTFKERKDGMDLALCAIKLKTKEVQFSGANNPLYIIRNGHTPLLTDSETVEPNKENQHIKLFDLKGTRQPVGKFEHRKPFEVTTCQLQTGDKLYMFTDGYADQFGGPKGKKFKYSTFKKLLMEIYASDMKTQHNIIDKVFEDWRIDHEQIDDVCVIGIEIT